jgi:hypothetical protein
VFAEAALPINKLTLVYGSDNGGRHGTLVVVVLTLDILSHVVYDAVHDSNSEMHTIMRQAGSMLNLKVRMHTTLFLLPKRDVADRSDDVLCAQEHVVARNLTTRPKPLYGPCGTAFFSFSPSTACASRAVR